MAASSSQDEKPPVEKESKPGKPSKAELQRRAKEAILKFRGIVTTGCGDWRCSNPHCFTNNQSKLSDKEASLKALKMFRETLKKNEGELKFECKFYSPKPINPLVYGDIHRLEPKYNLSPDSMEFKELSDHLALSFHHWEILEKSFRTTKAINEDHVSLNFNEIDLVNKLITQNDDLAWKCAESLQKGIAQAISSDRYGSSKSVSFASLRVIMVLFESPLVLSEDPSVYSMTESFLKMIDSLNPTKKRVLSKWMSEYPDVNRLKTMLQALQQFLTIRVIETEDDISDKTSDWKKELGPPLSPEQREEFIDRIRDRQADHRELFMTHCAIFIVNGIDLIKKANDLIIESSVDWHIDDKGNRSSRRLISPHISAQRSRSALLRAVTRIASSGEEEQDRSMSVMDLGSSSPSSTEDVSRQVRSISIEPDSEKTEMADEVPPLVIHQGTDERKESPHRRLSLVGISQTRIPIDHESFYNSGINEIMTERSHQKQVIHQIDFWNWRRKTTFAYLSFPYLLDAGTKSLYLAYENKNRQRQTRHSQWVQLMMNGQASGLTRDDLIERLDLVLRVRRDHILTDTLPLLQVYGPADLKRKLRIFFDGEEGVDQGGLSKEWAMLLVKELFDPKYGMFVLNSERGTYWFNRNAGIYDSESGDTLTNYRLIGVLIGIAIYNNLILDFRFPKAIFTKLLGKEITWNDFIDFDPDMAKGFEQLLNFEGDVESTYFRTFSVKYKCFGMEKEDELKPGGSKIALTNENREEYVDLMVKYLLTDSIAKQFNAFKAGFKMLADSPIFDMYRPDEFELIVCGTQKFDFEALEASTRYQDGFTKKSIVIRWFWEVVHAMSETNKRKLLSFATGSDRVPIRGLGELVFTIIKQGDNDERLPSSHTCFNVLMLPAYSSKAILKEKLMCAIDNSTGFGLL